MIFVERGQTNILDLMGHISRNASISEAPFSPQPMAGLLTKSATISCRRVAGINGNGLQVRNWYL